MFCGVMLPSGITATRGRDWRVVFFRTIPEGSVSRPRLDLAFTLATGVLFARTPGSYTRFEMRPSRRHFRVPLIREGFFGPKATRW